MNDSQENKLKMYFAVQKVVTNNTEVWKDLKAFADVFTQFGETIQEIQSTRMIQEGNLTGISKDKAQKKEDAISKAVEISSAVFAYASIIRDHTLMAKVDYSPSELRKSRDTILIDQLQVIHEATQAELADLANYGIEADDLAELKTLTHAYEQLLDEPRVAITDRAQATTALADLFAQGDTQLKEQMDKLMVMYKTTHAKFYQTYTNARKIIDLGVRYQTEAPQEM